MRIRIKHINRLFLLATAPFLGIAGWLLLSGGSLALTLSQDAFPQAAAHERQTEPLASLSAGLDDAAALAAQTRELIRQSAELYDRTNAEMTNIAQLASAQRDRPLQIYDRRITQKLGSYSRQVQSDKLRAQLYFVKAQHFIGYALKVKLKSPDAMALLLGKDEAGGAETTLEAVKRSGAIAGVNAGGFADGQGKRFPLSTTIVGGEYVDGFEASYKDLFFVGINEQLKLIGGKYKRKEELDEEKPLFGASFVPILMQDGRKQPIPDKWKTTPRRAPRTVIANYKDDQLLFLVTDGYDERGGSGATLEELQILLERFGVKDAYNLDGGGSSSLVFDGRVVNNPSDGKLRKLATNFVFFK